MAVNSMDYSGKGTVLDVIRTERARFFDIMDDTNNWNTPTRCTGWEVRDLVSHMIDVTEGYLSRWDLARNGEEADPPIGVLTMGERLNENAMALRVLPREEAVARLKTASDEMLGIFDRLTVDEWGNFLVNHPYMGPLPTLFYPAFHVMDYGVHTWDMEWGMGRKGDKDKLDERTAGVLVPFMFVLMSATVDQKAAEGLDIEYGIVVDGEWGGKWRVQVKDGTYTATPTDDLDGVQAVVHFKDASDFVLTTFQRIDASEASGDPEVIEKIRRLFFTI
jgi:uncharacterized protein (TIGR03083 family)